MSVRFLVLAKAPVPGRVKTRLCPPCTPTQAAAVAEAALADTLDTVDATPAIGRTLVLDGLRAAPPGWDVVPQRGDGLGERLAHAYADATYADTRLEGRASLLVGMDTPQLTVELLSSAADLLTGCDAVLGMATDGGWWGLGLREPAHAAVLTSVPMSTSQTGPLTLAALQATGLRVAMLPMLSDVDTAVDAHTVAASCPPQSRFAQVVAQLVPQPAIL